MLSVQLLVNSRLLAVKIWGVKSCMRIFNCSGGSVPLIFMLFKDQLYLQMITMINIMLFIF